MKKILSIILVLSIVMATAMATYASDTDLYLLTEKSPQSINTYVEENISKFLSSKCNEGEISLDCITVGEAFTIDKENVCDIDVFYFPVFQKGELKYTFRVYESENSITGILSPYLVNELQSIVGRTTINNPARLLMSNGNIVAMINNKMFTILNDPLGKSVDKRMLIDENAKSSINFMEEKGKKLHVVKVDEKAMIQYTVEREMISIKSVSSKNLTLDLKETQGQQSWCSAFAGASIIRYKTNEDVYAKDIMEHFYPDSKNLEDESISNSQLIEYAEDKDLSPVKKSSTLSLSSVVSQINNDQPVYLGCEGKGSYKKARHALVLRGYDKTNETYSVWNPWYNYYETIPMDTMVYTVNSTSSFKWDATIYNWK